MKRLYLILLMVALTLAAHPAPLQAQDDVGELLGRINGLRTSLGLRGYTLNAALTAAAQNQASWMSNSGQISHTQPDGSTPRTRAVAAGYQSTWVSENIYMGTSATAVSAWNWWLNSPIHYAGITSGNNSEIGVASAAGASGKAYVLVFGNPGGLAPVSVAPSVNNAASGAIDSPISQPSFVVGVDNLGNILHEIQPGDTLGDIAIIYGYTWAELPYIREINGFTEAQGRQLEIGAVLLVPPWEGTFTPTPGDAPTATAQPTSDVIVVTMAPTFFTSVPAAVQGQQASDLAASIAGATPQQVRETPTPAWVASTVTPTPLIVAVADDSAQSDMQAPPEVVIAPDAGNSPLLYVAVALQTCLLCVAGFEFWRRRQR